MPRKDLSSLVAILAISAVGMVILFGLSTADVKPIILDAPAPTQQEAEVHDDSEAEKLMDLAVQAMDECSKQEHPSSFCARHIGG